MYVHDNGVMRVIFFLIIVGPLTASFAYAIVAGTIRWFAGFFDYGPIYPENQPLMDRKDRVLSYTPQQRIDLTAPLGTTVARPYRVGLVAGEREMPPRPAFFGRLGGEEIETVGEYEEKHLNTWELAHWDKIKAQKLALDTPIGAKIAQTLAKYGVSEQNQADACEILPKESKIPRVWNFKTQNWTK